MVPALNASAKLEAGLEHRVGLCRNSGKMESLGELCNPKALLGGEGTSLRGEDPWDPGDTQVSDEPNK